MKERPILFQSEMVKALLAGAKTQTRRVVNPQPPFGCSYSINGARSHALCFQKVYGTKTEEDIDIWVPPTPKSVDHRLPCPYGQPGDQLIVREAHWRFGVWYEDGKTKNGVVRWRFRPERLHNHVCFEPPLVKPNRTSNGWHKRPGIFLPWTMARIRLEILSVWVERVQEISEDDAKAEGCVADMKWPLGTSKFRKGFINLWDSINGKTHPWKSNPWVWVLEFKKV